MARINTYPSAGDVDAGDVFIIDGPRGTRSVDVKTIMDKIPTKYVDDENFETHLQAQYATYDIDFSQMFT